MWGGFRAANPERLMDNGCNFEILNWLQTQRAGLESRTKIMGQKFSFKRKTYFPIKIRAFFNARSHERCGFIN